MKYKCLVFDHDDTVVNSTATIHHPCFQRFLDIYRPGMKCDLEYYFKQNFAPGFIEMCTDEYGLSTDELEIEVKFWADYVSSHIPKAYPGIKEIMEKHRSSGGIIGVISHSLECNIRRDYAANRLPSPDLVFGWEQPAERRKPNAWPLEQMLEQFSLDRSDVLMIDDLKPGYDMARKCGVAFAAVGWANDIPEIETFMRSNSDFYFKTVTALDRYLFE